MNRNSAIIVFALALGAVVGLVPAPAQAQSDLARSERLIKEGHELLKVGNYFQASERFSAAVLGDPGSGQKKLAFGHALFALGHYAYAAFNFRRGLRYDKYPEGLNIPLDELFPDHRAVERLIRDVRRYLGYYPGDNHALTVLAYATFFRGDSRSAEQACLELLKQNRRDPFAAYLLRRSRSGRVPLPPKVQDPPPLPTPQPLAIDPALLPPGERMEPLAIISKEDPDPALSRP